MQIVTVKGFGSGLGALCIALAIGEGFPLAKHIAILLLLGFVSYGLSIYCYTYAQRTIGTARTSTYYALAPFIGAALSFPAARRAADSPLPHRHRRDGRRLLAGRQKRLLI